MGLSFGLLWNSVIVVACIVWCGAILPRWREDLNAIHDPKDPTDRVVALLLWGVTLVAILILVNMVVALAL